MLSKLPRLLHTLCLLLLSISMSIVTLGCPGDNTGDTTLSSDNHPPVAQAGPTQSAAVGTTVQLDGSRSSDVDDDPLTFR